MSPTESENLLKQKYSKSKLSNFKSKQEDTEAKSKQHNKRSLKGNYNIIYKFNENVLQGETDVRIDKSKINLKNFKNPINLKRK